MNADSNASRGKILLIEDEAGFRRLVTMSLLKHGYEVLEASDGSEGVKRAVDSRPDLILCDLVMPQMHGYEVLAELQRDERLADIPVIFLTGQSELEQIRQGMNLGADDYLTKPANIVDLLGAIAARLNRRRPQRRRAEMPPGRGTQAIGNDTCLITTSREKRLIRFTEIRAVLADGEYSWVYWDKSNKGALIRKPLKQWQAELPRDQFLRVHRHAIINLAFLDRVEKLPQSRLQLHLHDVPEPILVSLSQTPALNRKLKALGR
jgi:DNA-binding response OmpR family regulator